jgi:hypothetical protein
LRILFFACCFLSYHCIFAQSERTPVSNIYSSIVAYSTKHNDVFSFTHNGAALANANNISAGVFGERRFMLQELSLYNIAAAMPTATGNFGLSAGYFGGSDYNETVIGLAYGRKLGTKVSVGAQFNYNTFKVSGYGNASAINFGAGVIFHITEQLNVGVHTYNPTNSKIGKNEEEKLPAIYTAGIGYDVSDKFFFGGEIKKIEDQDVTVNAGVQYKFVDQLFARAGFSSGTTSYYLGLGVLLKSIRIDATASIHQQLGVTPGLMLIFNGSTKSEE